MPDNTERKIVQKIYSDTIRQEQREDSAYSILQNMGITLLRSGNKPGTRQKSYRLLVSDRLTIDEVEKFIAQNSGQAKVTRRH